MSTPPPAATLIASAAGCHHFSTTPDQGLAWEGCPPSQGGPAVLLVECRHGRQAALLATLVRRLLIPQLGQGSLISAQEFLVRMLWEHRAEAPAISVLMARGDIGLLMTSGQHRIVSVRHGRARVIPGAEGRPLIGRASWQPGRTLVALARATDGALPLGMVGRVLRQRPGYPQACRSLVAAAAAEDPDAHHACVMLGCPEPLATPMIPRLTSPLAIPA